VREIEMGTGIATGTLGEIESETGRDQGRGRTETMTAASETGPALMIEIETEIVVARPLQHRANPPLLDLVVPAPLHPLVASPNPEPKNFHSTRNPLNLHPSDLSPTAVIHFHWM